MKAHKQIITGVMVLLFLNMLICEAYTQCNRAGLTINNNTRVYDRIPVFYTGKGWQLGRVIDTLRSGISVRVCEEVEVGFFIGKKKWYRIEYGTNKSGWIYSSDLRISLYNMPKEKFSGFISLAKADNSTTGATDTENVPSHTKHFFYILMFFITLLGMFGKVAFDELDKVRKFSFKTCFTARRCIKTIILAPLTFLVFLQTGDYSVQNQVSIIVAMCFAFQNGFFWQTVLPGKTKK